MHSLYFVCIWMTFSCIGCVHDLGVQSDVFSDQDEYYQSHNGKQIDSLTSALSHSVFKREANNTKEGSKKEDNTLNEQASISQADPEKSVALTNETAINSNTTEAENSTSHLHDPRKTFNPGATKRGALVFGGLTLCALLYLTFKVYRNKQTKSDGGNTYQSSEAPQFRYGVLKSQDNMERYNLPLNMESDEDEDDLQLFDLKQSKREMSNSNLRIFSDDNDGKSDIEVLDLDLTLPGDRSQPSDRSLLLDIDDDTTNPLISLQPDTRNVN